MSVLRETIVDAIVARLYAVATPTYHNTLTGKVFGFFGKTSAASEIVVDVQDRSETIQELSGAKWDRRMAVEIHVQYPGTTSDTSCRELIEDVYKAIGTDRTWSGNAIDTAAVSDEMETEQEERRVTGARIVIEVLYRTGAWAES